MIEGTRGIFIDMPFGRYPPRPDDFVVAVSAIKSGAVYLVESVRKVEQKRPQPHRTRYQMRVFRVDLPTLAARDRDQVVYCMHWYPRTKKAEA